MQTFEIDREQFHQMMRRLKGGPHEEAPGAQMRTAMTEDARRMAYATAAQTGGKVKIIIEGANG